MIGTEERWNRSREIRRSQLLDCSLALLIGISVGTFSSRARPCAANEEVGSSEVVLCGGRLAAVAVNIGQTVRRPGSPSRRRCCCVRLTSASTMPPSTWAATSLTATS